MKKALLLGLMATCMATSGFALTNGEYVYTPQGRFHINGANTVTNANALSGWTVVTAVEGQTIGDNFVMNSDGYATGVNSFQSLNATAGEGMYYKFTPESASGTYVVSYKMKAAALTSVRIKTTILSTNLVKVEGNTDNTYGGTTDVAVANTAEELNTDWQTFNYAIVGDGVNRAYFISFTGMATDIEIADLQIAPAYQVADLRQRDAAIEKINAYVNVYDWDEDLLEEWGIADALESLNGVTDETTQDGLDQIIKDADDAMAEFLAEYMEDYLAGNNANYFHIDGWTSKLQKQDKLGDWTCYPAGRGFWENSGTYPDLGHYAGNTAWCGGSADAPMGVSLQKELMAGSYVFAIEGNGAMRENATSSTWENNDGAQVAYGVAYVVKMVDGVATDTVASVVKGLHPVNYTPFVVAAKVEEDGTYEFGFKAYCKDEYKSSKNGSVVYVKDASIWGKNESLYSQVELAYYNDVVEQITTGRTNITTAQTNIADASIYWGKTALQDTINVYEPVIADYEAWTQDEIIATYQNYYEKTTSNDNGLMVYEVYQSATKQLIAANRTFTAVNDTLNSLGTAIASAENTLSMRVYDSATGKADLQAAIDKAKGVQTQMQATDYSEENAAAVVAAVKELNEAVATFQTTVPAANITEIISLDFEKGATYNESEGVYQIEGTNTVMSISNFSTVTPTSDASGDNLGFPFELGFDSNGEKVLPGVLRVGNGEGVATIPAKDYGTNILKVSMDMWYVRLSGKYIGFNLKDEADERVAGWYMTAYDGAYGSGYDDFRLDYCDSDGANNYIKDFFVANTTGDAGSCADNNLTHIECFFDYGEKSMYLVTTTPDGATHTSDKVAFNALVPTTFTVLANVNNYNGRRSWFDNLKIEQITAGPADEFVDGIEEVTTAEQTVAPVKKVFKNGRIVINGKYGINGIVIK